MNEMLNLIFPPELLKSQAAGYVRRSTQSQVMVICGRAFGKDIFCHVAKIGCFHMSGL